MYNNTAKYKILNYFKNLKIIVQNDNFSLEMKKKLLKSCIWSVALYGSGTWTLRKIEEGIINVFETWCWRRMLKIKWRDGITKFFKRQKKTDYFYKF